MSVYSLLDAPSILGLRPTGVEKLPEALRSAGLRERLVAEEGGRVAASTYDPARDPTTQLLNGPAIQAHAIRLADAVERLRQRGRTPLVLGGDCSILLGCLLALRRSGRFGLAFLDGHADFYAPEESPTGEVADMELGLVTGRGPALLADLEGRGPLLREEDCVAIGFRDHDEFLGAGARDVRATRIHILDLPTIRGLGIAGAAQWAVNYLQAAPLQGFWLHLDADVIHDGEMPAVDYRLPDGLRRDEVSTVLRALSGTGVIAGVSVTIFNPALDADGVLARALVHCLAQGIAPLGSVNER